MEHPNVKIELRKVTFPLRMVQLAITNEGVDLYRVNLEASQAGAVGETLVEYADELAAEPSLN